MKIQIDKRNQIYTSEIDPCKCSQPIFGKGAKTVSTIEQRLSSIFGPETTGHPHLKNELKVNHRPICKMQNFETPRSNVGENLDDLGYSDDFFDTTSKAQSLKKLISWNDFNLKILFSERQYQENGKEFSDRLVENIYLQKIHWM